MVKKPEFADYFPQMEAYNTPDSRVFMTEFEKVSSKKTGSLILEGTKRKTYFCCIVGGDCYGVDVLRPLAVKSELECKEALDKVITAADYYEKNGLWPPSDNAS